ncbi:MAG: S9 family peptidase [Gemmatimonadaceae bacterium]
MNSPTLRHRISKWTRSRLGAIPLGLLVSTVALAGTATAQGRGFTIDDAMSAPFPSALTAAPAGGRVAWIFDAQGSRNIWIGEPAGAGAFKPRQLTRFTGDIGIEIGTPIWTADGERVFFERGGEPNPQSLPLGTPHEQLWTMALSDTAPTVIGDGTGLVVAPKGRSVAYTAGNSILLAAIDGSGKPQPVVKDQGRVASLAWSPDGSRIAFVSARGTHNLIGVYDVAKKSLMWLAPSVDRDASPIWSPDGARVAFIRMPASTPGPFSSTQTAAPWSIWVADPATGMGHELWRASAGAGSRFYPLEGNQAFLWGADDQIVFPWEGTGWVHLYSISANGGAPKLLTPGNFEIFSADLSPDRRNVVYSANQDDLDHRHIWEVAVAGGAPTAITTGATIADLPVYASDGRSIAFLYADAQNPMRPATVTRSGVRFSAAKDFAPQTLPAVYPGVEFVTPQQVIFRSPDGMMVHGQLFLPPKESRNTKHPALLFFHGGPYRQMLLGANPMGAYSYMYAENQYFASRGYIVLSVNYRGGTGYGLDFRVPPHFGPDGASEFNDVMGGANYLNSRPDVDSKRMGVWGGSYGGYLTALALARASNTFATGVDYAGVHSWSGILKAYAAGGTQSATDSTAWASSPLSSINDWRSPTLVIQADDDHNVPFDQTVMLMTELRAHKIPSELIVIPDEIHDLLLHRSWLTYFHAQSDYLDKHLLH